MIYASYVNLCHKKSAFDSFRVGTVIEFNFPSRFEENSYLIVESCNTPVYTVNLRCIRK